VAKKHTELKKAMGKQKNSKFDYVQLQYAKGDTHLRASFRGQPA